MVRWRLQMILFQCILNPILNDHIFFEDQIMLLWPEALLACLTSKLVVISGRHIVAQSGTTIFLVCVAILKGIISSTLQQSNIISSLSRLTLVFLTCWRDRAERKHQLRVSRKTLLSHKSINFIPKTPKARSTTVYGPLLS